MGALKLNFNYYLLLSLLLVLFSSASYKASIVHKEKSIQEVLEEMSPTVNFSFSKNIIDFFDIDLDWKETRKHLEGDFSKANFIAFDKSTSGESLDSLFNNKGYFMYFYRVFVHI